jgi:hypothetical protein
VKCRIYIFHTKKPNFSCVHRKIYGIKLLWAGVDRATCGSVGITPGQFFARLGGVKCKTLLNIKTFFVRMNLGLSEAAAQGPAVGARRARKMVTPKCA